MYTCREDPSWVFFSCMRPFDTVTRKPFACITSSVVAKTPSSVMIRGRLRKKAEKCVTKTKVLGVQSINQQNDRWSVSSIHSHVYIIVHRYSTSSTHTNAFRNRRGGIYVV